MKGKLRFKLMIFSFAFLVGCNTAAYDSSSEPEPVEEISLVVEYEEEEEEIEEEIDMEGLAINPLTGLIIDEEIAMRRPVAVVINNIPRALPQSGISQADILYEVVAEGGITRIVGIFTDFDSEKIGPIRSTRDYFTNFAMDHNAVLIHHGGSPQGYSEITRLGINNLDGMVLEGTMFWRDPVRNSQSGMREHSSYTDAENIFTTVSNRNIDMEVGDFENEPFRFFAEPTKPEGGTEVIAVTVPFSNSKTARFVFDEETGNFRRYQNGQPQIDEETGEQLEVENVIIQKVNQSVIAGDEAGRIRVDLVGQGAGYLVTNGVYVPITWRKDSTHSPTQWFDASGEKLQINKGQTWVCVFQNTRQVQFEMESEED